MKKSKLVTIVGGSVVALATALGGSYYAIRTNSPHVSKGEIPVFYRIIDKVAEDFPKDFSKSLDELKKDPKKYKEFTDAFDSTK